MKKIIESKVLKNFGTVVLAIAGLMLYSNYVKDDFATDTFEEMYLQNTFDRSMVVFNVKDADGNSYKKYIEIEIADTAYERAVGLMFREELEVDKGMLFVFQEDTDNSFWMKNTLIPLDIIYISDDSKIVSVINNAEPCEVETCPTYPAEGLYKYALEVNGGFVAENDVKVGDSVEIFIVENNENVEARENS